MRMRTVLPLVAALALLAPGSAAAYVVHTVAPGESLTSVAAQDGLSVDQLAAANGLSPEAALIAGTSLSIPPQGASTELAAPATSEAPATTESAATPVSDTSTSAGGGYVVQPGDTLSGIAAANGMSVASLAALNGLDPNGVLLSGSTLSFSGSGSSSAATAPVSDTSTSAAGGYVVQPGDTLSGIAAAHGMSVEALASMNGLDPNGVLLSGSTLSFSGAGSGSSATSATSAASAADASGQPIGLSSLTSGSGPNPTAETVSSSEVGAIAAAAGVPASFAEAIGYQESGFNNNLVSSTGARGVMQIEPGTWDWIQGSLAGNSLSANSATDNVRGGVLMLKALLQSTGGNEAEAAAGYYQGLSSVQQNGMYADTQNYVNNVMALSSRFGGG
jgi:LysM repeat protein